MTHQLTISIINLLWIINEQKLDNLIALALEDLPAGDITTRRPLCRPVLSFSCFLAKEEGVLAGLEIAVRVLAAVDEEVKLAWQAGWLPILLRDITAQISGRASSILKAERTALNFLQRLSGIATLTRAFVEKLRNKNRYP